MKIGKDWAGYASAAADASGNKGLAKGLSTIQRMKEKKRDRAALKESSKAKDYWRNEDDGGV